MRPAGWHATHRSHRLVPSPTGVKTQCAKTAAATVVCVHGAGGGGWEWGIWARVLAHARLRRDRAGPDACRRPASRKPRSPTTAIRCSTGAAASARAPCSPAPASAVCSRSRSRSAVKPAALVLVNPLPPAGVLARPLHAARPADRARGRVPRSLASTRRAMPDADDAARLYALRRWRDESGAVLNEARDGVAVDAPRCPTLFLAERTTTPTSRRPPCARSRCGFRPISARFRARATSARCSAAPPRRSPRKPPTGLPSALRAAPGLTAL